MRFAPNPEREKKEIRFFLCFASCFTLLSPLELGTENIWHSLTRRPAGETAVEIALSNDEKAASTALSDASIQDESTRGKIPAAKLITAALLSILISEYVGTRCSDCGRTVKERIRNRLRGRIKYLA